jgi:HSP20 family protein
MANITRFDPFAELSRFGNFPDMNDFFKGFSLRPVFAGAEAEPQMKIDVTEEKTHYLVKAEVPGVKKEDIHVTIDGNRILISAEMKKEREEKEGKELLCSERYFGKIARSFALDQEVDRAAAQARYVDGVLELMLPKKPGTTAMEVPVH